MCAHTDGGAGAAGTRRDIRLLYKSVDDYTTRCQLTTPNTRRFAAGRWGWRVFFSQVLVGRGCIAIHPALPVSSLGLVACLLYARRGRSVGCKASLLLPENRQSQLGQGVTTVPVPDFLSRQCNITRNCSLNPSRRCPNGFVSTIAVMSCQQWLQ